MVCLLLMIVMSPYLRVRNFVFAHCSILSLVVECPVHEPILTDSPLMGLIKCDWTELN